MRFLTSHNDILVIIAELNLESGSVSSGYFLASHRELCREEKLVLVVWHYPDDKPHFPLHCLGVCKQRRTGLFRYS